MRVRGISSNTLINVDNGGGNTKAGLAPSTGYMRRADKAMLFRMKSHRDKKIFIISLSETERIELMDRLKEVFDNLVTENNNLNESEQKTPEELKKDALQIVKNEFKNIIITDDDIELTPSDPEDSESQKEPTMKPGVKPKKKVTKHVPIN